MELIENQTFDEERAFYGCSKVTIRNCSFDGPADGESAFKESSDIFADKCFFNLRYPFWHVNKLKISGSEMTDFCRAGAHGFFSLSSFTRSKHFSDDSVTNRCHAVGAEDGRETTFKQTFVSHDQISFRFCMKKVIQQQPPLDDLFFIPSLSVPGRTTAPSPS